MAVSFSVFASEEIKYIPNLADGELLWNEGCARCHDNNVYSIDKNSYIMDIKELRDQITKCVNYLELPWYPDYEEDVVHYLNVNYFKFEVDGDN